jgi:hypothetical protein
MKIILVLLMVFALLLATVSLPYLAFRALVWIARAQWKF